MDTLIDKILSKGEDRRTEFKSTLPEGNQIAQTVIAFANGVGGEIFIGIEDKTKKVIGVPDADIFKFEEKISQIVFDNCHPLIIPDIAVYPHHNKNILCVKVYPNKNGPFFLKSKGKNKGTFIRIGSTNRVADDAILGELERKARNISFDSLPAYDVPITDCQLDEFKNFYLEKCGKKIGLEQLKSMDFIKVERNVEFATNAAILSSSNKIKSKVFPYAKIECARFKGNTTALMIDQQTIDGPIFKQPEEVMKFIMRNISQASTIELIYRKDRWEYPLIAIREAIINAIIHRDYSILGSDIKIAIFDDMLEITSPGSLMPTVCPDALENTPSEIRNRTIAPIFKACKLIEQWGSGFQKIFTELTEYPTVSMKINEPGLSFQLQFLKYEPALKNNPPIYEDEELDGGLNGGLNGGLKALLKAIENEEGIQTRKLAITLKKSNKTVEKQLKTLINRQLIEHRGSKKTGGYWLTNPNSNQNTTSVREPSLAYGGLNGGLKEGLNGGLNSLFSLIKKHPGIQSKQASALLKTPPKTIENQLYKLIEKQIVEHRGSKKTGGYHVVKPIKK